MKKNNWNKWIKQKWKWVIILVFLIGYVLLTFATSDSPKELTYQELQTMVNKKEVETISINKKKEKLTITDKNGNTYVSESPSYEDFKKEMMEEGVAVYTKTPSEWTNLVSNLVTLFVYVGIFYLIYRSVSGGKMNKTETPAEIPKTKFSDIAAYSEQKQDLSTYVEYLKNPKKFQERGANMPKGVLLYGPPGTGKTLFARAVAGEAGVPFFSVSGSDFIEMFVGLGAKRVRSLFEKARDKAPCIIFIDEIDSIGGKRNALSNSEQNQTINALLTEMDGFAKDSGILVLATTNQPNNLDPALMRSGRFDSHIAIPLPLTAEDRLKIIEVHKKGRKFDTDIDFDMLAKQWVGFSGADIESVLNEAAIIATSKDLPTISKTCLDEAFYKKILKGHVKKSGQSERKKEELELVAYHEAGHAVARKLLKVGEVSKVTILSTTSGAGGVTFNIPEKMGLFTKEELESEIKILYAGRVAEYLLYNKDFSKVTTGAQNDIERATEIIKGMVIHFGLQREPILINLSDLPEASSYVFEEMQVLSKKLFEETVSLLEKHYSLLQAVAEKLLEKESIEASELNKIARDYEMARNQNNEKGA